MFERGEERREIGNGGPTFSGVVIMIIIRVGGWLEYLLWYLGLWKILSQLK